MPFQEISILLPCHSLDDFPVYHKGGDAESLLASWAALWHPYLIDSAKKLPSWKRVDDPPGNCQDLLLVAPTVSMQNLPTGFVRRAAEEGGCLVCEGSDRRAISHFAIEFLVGSDLPEFDESLVEDFYALGYCYLQIQLLTRHMRYSSNLDMVFFEKQVVSASAHAIAGEKAACREHLQSCFDVLAEERNHFYPVDAFLLDLTLVAETTLHDALSKQIEHAEASNLLMSARVAQVIKDQHPILWSALHSRLESGAVELVGGEFDELRLPLLASESILAELREGERVYEGALGRHPTVFGRRRFGLTAVLPQVLVPCGFQGALHATLDDGRFPEGMQIKTCWDGGGGTTIDSYAKVPLDASLPESFLNLAIKMGEAMDMDHVATVCFAHWPGKQAVWYDDLRRAASYSSALGSFVTFSQFFKQAGDPGHDDRFRADQYRSPYLKQSVARQEVDPLSRTQRYWQQYYGLKAHRALDFLAHAIAGEAQSSDDQAWRDVTAISEHVVSRDTPTPRVVDDQLIGTASQAMAERIPRKGDVSEGWLFLNPCNFVRRIGVEVDGIASLPDSERPVYAASQHEDKTQLVVDVPAMGFAWVHPGSGRAPSSRKNRVLLAEDFLLRNEYFEVVVDQTSGGIRSIHEYNARKNRISQQLAMRLGTGRGDEAEDRYSRMVADSIEVISATETCGRIRSQGTLVHDESDEVLARFVQTMTVWRGSRIIEIDIELEPSQDPGANPWDSYFASRFAWRDEAADLSVAINQHRLHVSHKRIESPEYIELEFDDKRTLILTGGMPFHHKAKLNILDSLLIVKGERARRFRMGIGLDVTHPAQAAEGFMTPPTLLRQTAAAPGPAKTSWLFHLDAKNVTASSWQSVKDAEGCGFRVRLLETLGREATLRLQSFRPIVAAEVLDFKGNVTHECVVENGVAVIPIGAHQFLQVAARW